MRDFPHSVVVQQIASPRPSVWLWLVSYCVPSFLLTQLTRGLLLWPAFVDFISHHGVLYRSSFLAVQLAVIAAVIFLLSRCYTDALWKPRAPFGRRSILSLCAMLPLVLFYLSKWPRGFHAIIELAHHMDNPTVRAGVDHVHHDIWQQLAYGPSLMGVVGSSVTAFVVPVLEEIMFSGLLANALARAFGVITALLITPALFSLSHTLQFGFGLHLIPLFCAGLTYTLIRFLSGKLSLAIGAHLLVNAIIFLPKWYIALLHFYA